MARLANTPTALKGLLSRLTRSGATLPPWGYRIQRQLTAAGPDSCQTEPYVAEGRRAEIIDGLELQSVARKFDQ